MWSLGKGDMLRWMELLASYDFEIAYTPGKGNVVADALSRKRLSLKSFVCGAAKLRIHFDV